MVEHRTENPCVPGSIPGGTTPPFIGSRLRLRSEAGIFYCFYIRDTQQKANATTTGIIGFLTVKTEVKQNVRVEEYTASQRDVPRLRYPKRCARMFVKTENSPPMSPIPPLSFLPPNQQSRSPLLMGFLPQPQLGATWATWVRCFPVKLSIMRSEREEVRGGR